MSEIIETTETNVLRNDATHATINCMGNSDVHLSQSLSEAPLQSVWYMLKSRVSHQAKMIKDVDLKKKKMPTEHTAQLVHR